MRITLDLNNDLLHEAKLLAVDQRTIITAIVEEGLRFLLTRRRQEVVGDWPICTQARPVPGLDLTNTGMLQELTAQP